MASNMSVSMTIKVIDEASAGVQKLASAMRGLKETSDSVGVVKAGRADGWDAERRAVHSVVAEVRSLGELRQDAGAIGVATLAYREEAAAIRGVGEDAVRTGERLADMVRRQRAEERSAFLARQSETAEAAHRSVTRVVGPQDSRADGWDAERRAVQGVAAEVRGLGEMRQDVRSIGAATSAYREEAAAIQGAGEGAARFAQLGPAVEGVTIQLQAFRMAAAEAEAPIVKAVETLHEEAAAVAGVISKMRELGEVSRAAPPTGSVDWGDRAGKNQDWNAYWRDRYGAPPEPVPTVTRPEGPSPSPEPVPGVPKPADQPPVAASGGGLISMVVGGAELGTGLKLIRGSYEQAGDAAGQRAAMRAAGIPQNEQEELTAAATRVSRQKRTFSDNEALDLARDARTILGSTPHAVEALPSVIDLGTLAEAKRPGQGMEGVMSLLKGMETSGATVTPERFQELSQSLAKVTNVFGKTISFADWGQVFKYGGTATQHLSPDFIEQKLPHLIQELGGSSTGTMLQTMERTIVAGRMDKGARETMTRYGLYDPETNAVKGASTFMRDPSAWVASVLKPTMDAAHLSEDERLAVEDKMFSSRLAARGMSILESQDAAVEKNAKQIRDAHGLEAAPELARTDPRLVQRGADAQSRNFERRAGDPVMTPLLAIENAYASAIGRMNARFDHAPGAATAAAAGLVGGAGYLGWKTWESGLGNTVKSIIRLPEEAGRGLMQGFRDGAAQARAEIDAPKLSHAEVEAPKPASAETATRPGAPTPATETIAKAAAEAAGAALKFSEASTSLGTLGLLATWAGRSDIGMKRPLSAESLAKNPLGIRLPGDPVPATAALPAAGPQGVSASAIQAMVAPLEAGILSALRQAAATMAMPSPKPTAADAPQVVTNNNQKTVNAPITVNAPVTISATMTNTTPGAIGAAVGAHLHAAVRAGAGALHDGTETK